MSKAQITDILILGLISGIVAILTSFMGISGTIIGSVVSSIIAEFLKTYFKNPVKDKISEYEKNQDTYDNYEFNNNNYSAYEPNYNNSIKSNYSYSRPSTKTQDTSYISSKILFVFPLVVILIIELIHFLSVVNIIPQNMFFALESITNWTLFRTIGYALIVMGFYPIISKKLGTHNGILLIIVGIIELIIGYADTNVHASLLFSLFSSLKDYVNIAIILAILYTILTIPDEIKESKKEQSHSFKIYDDNYHMQEKNRKFQNREKNYSNIKNNRYNSKNNKFNNIKNNQNYNYDDYDDDDYFYY